MSPKIERRRAAKSGHGFGSFFLCGCDVGDCFFAHDPAERFAGRDTLANLAGVLLELARIDVFHD